MELFAPSDVQQPLSANTARTGSVHRHHVATGQRSLDPSRVATLKLLSKASSAARTVAQQSPARSRRRFITSPRRPFRSRHSLWLPTTAPNGSRLPCRAGLGGNSPSPVWTFAQITAPALARVLLRPHSQSPGHDTCASRRAPPRNTKGSSSISDKCRIDSQVARRFSRRVVWVCLRLSPPAAFALVADGASDFSGSNVEAPGYPSQTTVRSLAIGPRDGLDPLSDRRLDT